MRVEGTIDTIMSPCDSDFFLYPTLFFEGICFWNCSLTCCLYFNDSMPSSRPSTVHDAVYLTRWMIGCGFRVSLVWVTELRTCCLDLFAGVLISKAVNGNVKTLLYDTPSLLSLLPGMSCWKMVLNCPIGSPLLSLVAATLLDALVLRGFFDSRGPSSESWVET